MPIDDWELIKDNNVIIIYKNKKTLEVIEGFHDLAIWTKNWYPIRQNGDYVKELHSTETKAEMKKQLETYIATH